MRALPAGVLAAIQDGRVIPAHPLALHEDGRFDELPVVQDHGGVEPQRYEAQRHRHRVTHPIAVTALTVVRSTVRLQDEAIADDEVDFPDSGNRNLTGKDESAAMHPESQDRLESTVGVTSREVHQPPIAARDPGP